MKTLSLTLLVSLASAVEPQVTTTINGDQPVITEPSVTAPKENPLTGKLLEQEFTRMPQTALQAMSEVMAGTVGTDAALQFTTDLQAGAWPSVAKTLKSLPADDADKVYDHILKQFVENNGQLLPSEVIDLAELSPSELNDARLRSLGNILRNSIQLVSTTGSLVARLEAGTKQFGGKDPIHRGRAAALLLAANRIIEAGSFLPPLDTAIQEKNYITLDLHARFLAATGSQNKQSADLIKSWELSLLILQGKAEQPAEKESRIRAANRCLKLIDDVPKETADTWLSTIFVDRPEIGQAVFASIAAQAAQSLENNSADDRRAALKIQHRVVTVLLGVDKVQIERWQNALNFLTIGWLNEASLVYIEDAESSDDDMEKYIRDQMRPYMSRIQPGQMSAYRNHFRQQYLNNRNDNRRNSRNHNNVEALQIADLLATAPTPEWLSLLDISLAQRLRILEGEFVCRSDDRDRAFTLIKDLSVDEPNRAGRLARSIVRGFTASLRSTDDEENNNNSYGGGIPLTRARQNRNLTQLASLLRRIETLNVQEVPAEDVVQAFVTCHSPAEVFRLEDITQVLGESEKLPSDVLVNLVSAMRSRLANTWRKPSVQQQAGTQRTDAEVVSEIERGYNVAKMLCSKSLELNPEAWKLLQVHASLNFDLGEFVYGQQASLAEYTAYRDAAFASYAQAAKFYSHAIIKDSSTPDFKAGDSQNNKQKPDITVFSQWFSAALGASDLAYLSRQQEADGDQVIAVRDAIAQLPDELSEKHRELFAKQIITSLSEIHAELKPRYLRHALRIIGDGQLADPVKKIITDYDDLIGEMQLDLSVDGASAVGNKSPFGVRFSLRHTTALGRESGGFSKYLQNNVQTYTGSEVNYRNDIEKHLRESLGEHFIIDSITFHASNVTSYGYGRDGWREMPLAYLVLRAKDPSVDRIPSVHIDLDFTDKHGPVILPVTSGITVIDAQSSTARTADVTDINMTLDDRELGAGIVRLEIRASGTGLIGDLDALLSTTIEGFTVGKVDDSGPTVASITVDGNQVKPFGERLWQIQYTPASGTIPSQFVFPVIKSENIKTKLQRYFDADILEANAIERLMPNQSWLVVLRPWLILAGLVAALGLVVWWVRRKQTAHTDAGPRHILPKQITPFSVLAVLKSIHTDAALPLDTSMRSRLETVIKELEQQSFSRNGQIPSADALEKIAKEWITNASA